MKRINLMSLMVMLFMTLTATTCKKEKHEDFTTGKFKVTIENVFQAKSYFDSGTFEAIPPGMSKSFSFNAGKGHYLSFATMFGQSNDLFYAPGDSGIPLYDNNGNAVTGDVTSMISLWDAGTEMNEQPGVGPNQGPRQTNPDDGVVENNPVNTVNDSFTYPATNTVIKVELAHNGETMFTVTITNLSDNATLTTPFSPGVWVINSQNQHPIFTMGQNAGMSLERLAESGNNSLLKADLMDKSGYFSPFAPGVYSVGGTNKVFKTGNNANSALEMLAEDGSPAGYAAVTGTTAFSMPDGSSSAGPLLPMHSYSFVFNAKAGDKLSFATMLVQSNDWFVGVDALDLFDSGMAISGDITDYVKLFDAGTEVDEYAGAGPNQPLRQAGPNTGADENGSVMIENSPSSNVPPVSEMVKVSIQPM